MKNNIILPVFLIALSFFGGIVDKAEADFEGTIGTRFTIGGAGFGNKKPIVYVEHKQASGAIRKIKARVENYNDTFIICVWVLKVPAGIYDLFVQPYDKTISPILVGTLTIRGPTIEKIASDIGKAGDVITMNGYFFSTKKPNVYLFPRSCFGLTKKGCQEKKCKVLKSVMDQETGISSLQFVVPKLRSDTYKLFVGNLISDSDDQPFIIISQGERIEKTWEKQVIDTGTTHADVGQDLSIAADKNGAIHASYFDNTNYDLKYATNAAGSWSITTVDDVGDVGEYSSIAVDGNGKVHISYLDYDNGDLKYATNASGAWVHILIDSGGYHGYVGQFSSIAVDGNGKVHISYLDQTSDDLKYATNASGIWITKTIDSTGQVGAWTSIAVDGAGFIHISYDDGTNRDLKYATNKSGKWTTATVDSQFDAGKLGSLAVNDKGKVHVIYYSETSKRLLYIENVGGEWIRNDSFDRAFSDLVFSKPSYNSLKIDGLGNLHLSSFAIDDFGSGDLIYATNASGSWIVEKIEVTLGFGVMNALAMEDSGEPFICYYNKGRLNYVKKINKEWVSQTIDSGALLSTDGDVGNHNSMATDSQGNVHISYYDAINLDLKYATNVSDIWNITVIDNIGDVGDYSSIATDTNGKVHISYDISRVSDYWNYYPRGFHAGLKYATNVSGQWKTFVINDYGRESRIAIDGEGNVHLVFNGSYMSNNELFYANNVLGLWKEENIAYGWGGSIATDGHGKVHIAFYGQSHYDSEGCSFKYATNISGSWSIQTVDELPTPWETTAIAVDSDGNVHICYSTETELRYANNISGYWNIATIDRLYEIGANCSIVLDKNNMAHVNYCTSHDGLNYLKYATNVFGQWIIETINVTGETESGIYCSNSIALDDSSGKVFVSYKNDIKGELEYAVKQ